MCWGRRVSGKGFWVFDGFEKRQIATGAASINVRLGGEGLPVLLLHGYPQTHVMWHRVAPILAERYTLVVADLRGYGDSSKPDGDRGHAAYSKRALAADQVEVMRSLGFERFFVVGHDRGARVGHRMALDHPDSVSKFAALDIVPTHKVFRSLTKEVAIAYYHWFFLAQPFDLPERLIGSDPGYYLRWLLRISESDTSFFAPEVVSEYERCFADPETIYATCEEYRAAASIDLAHDDTDFGRKVECPMLVLWGERGKISSLYDVPAVWREYARDVSGAGIAAAHYLAEERPEAVLEHLADFLAQD